MNTSYFDVNSMVFSSLTIWTNKTAHLDLAPFQGVHSYFHVCDIYRESRI